MKPILTTIIMLALLCVAAKSGCDEGKATAATSKPVKVSGLGEFVKMQFENHEYLVFDFSGVESGGAMCHSESCPCKPNPVFKPEKAQ